MKEIERTDDRGLPQDFAGCLPHAYDRRATPRPEILDRRGYEQKLAADLQAMRARAAGAGSTK